MTAIITYVTGAPLNFEPPHKLEEVLEFTINQPQDLANFLARRNTFVLVPEPVTDAEKKQWGSFYQGPYDERFAAASRKYVDEGVVTDKGIPINFAYLGILTRNDFQVFDSIQPPAQTKDDFLRLTRQTAHKKHLAYKTLIARLEEIVDQMKPPYKLYDAKEIIIEGARQSGQYIPISFSLPWKGDKPVSHLTDEGKTLIYADGTLAGELVLNGIRMLQGEAGDEGQVEISLIGKPVRDKIKWFNNMNMNDQGYMALVLDPSLRKRLGEKPDTVILDCDLNLVGAFAR